MDRLEQVGIIFPEILIPDKKTNIRKWPVIACDQFTSNKDYWNKTAKLVGGAPSTLHIIVPEAFLKDDDIEDTISHAKETMVSYIENGVLVRLPKGLILVERETPFGTRIGLVLAIDLEQYDIDHTKKPLIRATEQTVIERIPPRMKNREGAVLECPHVMLMLNDPKDSVIGPVYQARGNHTKVYETPLMQGGGNLKGWFIDDEEVLDNLVDSLEELKSRSEDGMLFAVGDGNHSLASAKAVWDKEKEEMSDAEREISPLRYALVEVVNLYDNGISMHPIHRVLFNVEASNALRTLVSILNDMGVEARMMYTRGARVQVKEGVQTILFESKMAKGRIEIKNPKHELLTVTLTEALDELVKVLPKAEVDYIHGEEEFHELSKGHACLGFKMDPMTKDQLFDFVAEYGVLPRKAFSLGEAQEKRYYFECRLLVNPEEEPEDEELEQQLQDPQEPIAEETEAVEEIEEAPPVRKKRKGLFGRKRKDDEGM